MRLTGKLTARRSTALLFTAGLAFGLGACSDDDSDDDAATDDTEAPADDTTDDTEAAADGGGGGGATITISGFAFNNPTAEAGGTVAITNEDGTTHTVTSDDDAWDEVSLGGGDSGELTAPSEPGDYAFHCEIHRSMTGTLTVT